MLINRNDKKMNKLKNAILTSVDFIQKNVISTREKDKNEMMKLKSFIIYSTHSIKNLFITINCFILDL